MSKDKIQPTIIQIIPEMKRGGAEQGAYDIGRMLTAHNYRSVILTTGGQLADAIEQQGSEVIRFNLKNRNPWILWRNKKRIQAIIESINGPKIVHARSRGPAWSAYWATQNTNTPFVTTVHGTYPWLNSAKRHYNSVMCKGDRVIVISPFMIPQLLRDYGADWSRIHVIPRGIDINKFDDSAVNEPRKLRFSAEWNLDPSKITIMMPGRITGWKGHQMLIKSLAQIKDSHDFQALIIGSSNKDDKYLKTLHEKVISLGLGSQVKFIPWERDMASAYAMADIVVSCSIEPEGFGRVSAEGMAMGRMVIAPRHGGATDQISHGNNGFLFEPGNHDDFVSLLRFVLALSNEHRFKIAAAARVKIRQNFTLEAMCQKTLETYQGLLESHQ